mmetsp:Transcript_43799/g.121179  ORF Transcript_43799/g.121179 Transcript_43799/m.121179 type:complete len:250 (+) Transcript_43799:455-1204(+)
MRLLAVQHSDNPVQHVQHAHRIPGDAGATHALRRRPLPWRRALRPELADERGVVGVGDAVPDCPWPAREHRMSDVRLGVSPRAAVGVEDRPMVLNAAPAQHASPFTVRGPALGEVLLEHISAAGVVKAPRANHANRRRPLWRCLRRVVAETEALTHEDNVELHIRFALRRNVKLWREVTGVVEGNKAMLEPPRHLPRQALGLPPLRDRVPQVAAEELDAHAFVLPQPLARHEGVREHDARRHVSGLKIR